MKGDTLIDADDILTAHSFQPTCNQGAETSHCAACGSETFCRKEPPSADQQKGLVTLVQSLKDAVPAQPFVPPRSRAPAPTGGGCPRSPSSYGLGALVDRVRITEIKCRTHIWGASSENPFAPGLPGLQNSIHPTVLFGRCQAQPSNSQFRC